MVFPKQFRSVSVGIPGFVNSSSLLYKKVDLLDRTTAVNKNLEIAGSARGNRLPDMKQVMGNDLQHHDVCNTESVIPQAFWERKKVERPWEILCTDLIFLS